MLDAIEYEAPVSPQAQKRASVLGGAGGSSPGGGGAAYSSDANGAGSGSGGVVPGLGLSVGGSSSPGPKSLEHAFKIITPKRTYLVCAPSEEDEIKWLAALQCLIARRSQLAASAGGAGVGAPAAVSPPAQPAPTAVAPNTAGPAPPTSAAAGPGPDSTPVARRPSQSQSQAQSPTSGPPPVSSSRPLHGRNRSVTDAARQAVRDVELRFHGGALQIAQPGAGQAASAAAAGPVGQPSPTAQQPVA